MYELVMTTVDAHPGLWVLAGFVSVMLIPGWTLAGCAGSLIVLACAYFAQGVAGSILFFLMATVCASAMGILPILFFGAEVNKEPNSRLKILGRDGSWIVLPLILAAAALEALSVWHVWGSVQGFLPF
jgi:hypothetical protein